MCLTGNLKMNKENLKRLIDVIEQSKTFSMHAIRWGNLVVNDEEFGEHPCGTPACISGHAIQLGAESRHLDKFLGIPEKQKYFITAPTYNYAHLRARPGEPGYITKSHAVRMLKKLLETGKVDWKGTKSPPKFDMKTWLSKLQNEELRKTQNEQRKPETVD